MYKVLDKDTIKSEILPFLSVAKRGYVTKSDLVEAIQCILYKLKMGCQWHMLPVSAIFMGRPLSYKSVYAHFCRWSRNGEWKKVWGMILSRHRSFLDMSSVDLDGSHTTTLRGGECCGYQGRKKRTTTNAIYVTDRQGIPLAMSTPVSGSHNDLHCISEVLQGLFAGIKDSGLSVLGLFLNADAGFDSAQFRRDCHRQEVFPNVAFNKRRGMPRDDELLDELLYKERYSIERTNRLPCPRLFRVLTTTFTTSPWFFRICSQVLRIQACPYRGSFSMQMLALTLHYSGEVAISRRCSQTSPSISVEVCGEMTSCLMSCFTRRDTALKGPMRGWTHTGACSTGSIPHKPVGRDGTISHLY